MLVGRSVEGMEYLRTILERNVIMAYSQGSALASTQCCCAACFSIFSFCSYSFRPFPTSILFTYQMIHKHYGKSVYVA